MRNELQEGKDEAEHERKWEADARSLQKDIGKLRDRARALNLFSTANKLSAASSMALAEIIRELRNA